MKRLRTAFHERFGSDIGNPPEVGELASSEDRLWELSIRRSHRRFDGRPVSVELLRTLAAVALASPSKSDLQQRDIIIVADPDRLAALKSLVADQAWTKDIPSLLVFCGNNRRQRQIHARHSRHFANDHLDAFFNAAVDAGIAMQAFITAAETVGLGCCPISAIRNRAVDASDLLGLPDHVFPVAGLAVGWPSTGGKLSMRLPLETTVHIDTFDESALEEHISAYNQRRAAAQPFGSQRSPELFGELPSSDYTWSEDKTRQYALPERQDFGKFILSKGFKLD